MARTKISEFSSTPASNTDIDGINIAEGCAPSGINDAIRDLMAQLKNWQSGTSNDPYVVGSSGSLTLNQGTANGVTYLNGSKVVTSGSALVFDGSNLGLGVTPSAWGSGRKILQMTNGAAFGDYSGYTGLSQNYLYNGSDVYIANGYATRYLQGAGSHLWYNAASGTAGNAITFTQAMTLDASGNLGIGTTSPSQKLSLGGRLNFASFSTNIDDYGVWATSADGLTLASYSTTNICFRTNSAERARIDSIGNLLCGITSATNDPAQGITLMQNGNIGNIGIGHANGTASGNSYVKFSYNATTIGNIAQSGTTAVLYNTTSDQRLKENIQDADSASSLIDALQVRQFDWKSDNSHQRYGFVAQELLTVAPEAVYQPADTQQMMAVDYSKLVPMLVKEIQSLRVRVAQLESK